MNPTITQAVKLGSLGVFLKGQGIMRTDVQSTGVPCLRYGEIYTRFDDYTDTLVSHVSAEVAATAVRLRKGDVVFAGSGETKAEIGKCIAWVGDADAVVGGDTIVLRGHGQDAVFLASLLNTAPVAKQKAARGQGDAVVHISARALSDIDIVLPPLDVQTNVSGTIRDTESLIASLERLINKKQAIKQGIMQQLLTGRTRLPGFSKPWRETTLGEVLTVRHGRNQHSVECSEGIYPILATGGEIGRTNTPLYSKPSVLIGRKGTIDRPQYRDKPFWTVDTLFYTEIHETNVPKYLYYLFLTIDWRSKNEASGVPSLSSSSIESISAVMPGFEEQKAIAKVLTNADTEIHLLETRLAKAKSIKLGMMQELLTGRTRLKSAAVAV